MRARPVVVSDGVVKLRPILFLPGMLFWALLIAGLVTKNDALVGVAVVLAAVTVAAMLTLKIRASAAAKAEVRRIVLDGKPATARVVSIGTKGGSFNDHPYVDLELEVELDDRPPWRASVHALISQLAIPRIQPECRIAVHVDPDDPGKVVVDAALTPYGYD